MTESIVRFPVVCPECRREVLNSLPFTFAAEALIRGKNIRLHSSCHDKWWDASSFEVERLRDYIGALAVAAQPEPSNSKNGPQLQLVIDNTT
jgi:hypothetical protein